MSDSNGTALVEADTQLQIKELTKQLGIAHSNTELLRETIAELELAFEDVGWLRMSGAADREFSYAGLVRLRRWARLSYLKNPLIRHGVEIQAHYVWGQGCSVSCRSKDVNDVMRSFLDDPKNTTALTGHQARLDKERELAVHGDLFLALFTNPRNGRVIVRSIFPDEIHEVITNPNDSQEPWYYERIWGERSFDPTNGQTGVVSRKAYYPDWRLTYNRDPRIKKPKKIGDVPVMWDSPVYHVKVGGFSDMRFGVPEVYSALDWARAVKDDLTDYATIRKAHSRFAFKLSNVKGKQGVASAKQFLSSTLNAGGSGNMEKNPTPTAGSTWLEAEGMNLSAFKTAGMVPSPEEGRRLWLLAAAGMGIPLTILSGDADVGNMATAKTLDRPTELQMESRRTLWADVYIDILNYVVDMAIKAPSGLLDGVEVFDRNTQEVRYVLTTKQDRTISFRYPSILQRDIKNLVDSIVHAATLNGKASAGLFDDKTIATMLLTALGEDEIDPIIDRIFPGESLTFNAGSQNQPDRNQGEQSGSDEGSGDMGDAIPPGQGITPGDLTPMGISASLRRGAAQIFMNEAYAARVEAKGRSRMMAA